MSVLVRVWGTPAECDAAVAGLRLVLVVRSVSGWRADRGDSILGRVYVEADVPPDQPPEENRGRVRRPV